MCVISMKTLLKSLTVTGLVLMSSNMMADDNERVRHFKGITASSVVEAQSILAEFNAKLAVIASKDRLEMTDLAEIHMLTYTLENQLEYLEDDLERVAEQLEVLHKLSETAQVERAKAQADVYLKNAKPYEK